MRLFAALEVADDVRDALDAAVAPLRRRDRDLRWNPAAQWHLTVAFLGDVDGGVDHVVAALAPPAAAAPAQIRLHLDAPGRFGKRVLWVGVRDDPPGSVAALGAASQRALEAAGLPVDRKDVHPHVTLARSRGRGHRPVTPATVAAVPAVDARWAVDELVLFASVAGGHGEPNRYEPQARLPLG